MLTDLTFGGPCIVIYLLNNNQLDAFFLLIYFSNHPLCRSQWPRGLRRRSAAACLQRSWVRIPPGAWMFVCCECCVLSGRGFCDELITRPKKSYRMWCVFVCHLETLRMRRSWLALGRSATEKKNRPLYVSNRLTINFQEVNLTFIGPCIVIYFYSKTN